MAKRKTKKIIKQVEKGLKKSHKFRVFFLSLLAFIIVTLGVTFYFNILIVPSLVKFNLNGTDTINVQVDDPFVDPGFTSSYRNLDLTDYVTTTITDSTNKDTVINTAKSGSYTITYTLKFKYIDLTLKRTVRVSSSNNIVTGDEELTIHFMELGNKFTGDSIYIKAGETDILIDAGSRASSAETIANYIDEYCVDGTLEYVIATHAHQDHISGFVGTKDIPGIFDRYECKTIIDFPLTNSTSKLYNSYVEKREQEVLNGAVHYTALECTSEINGAKKVYQLADGISLTVLYNYFYDHTTSGENDYSVCVLLTHDDKNFLFTGDLETKGEKELIKYNALPEVEIFKAGHHGSPTSTSDELLDVIKPKAVVVTCCGGWGEYTDNVNNQFPSQSFITKMAKHGIERVYVTDIISDDGTTCKPLNGTVIVGSSDKGVGVLGTHNSVILKETDWFKQNRVWE